MFGGRRGRQPKRNTTQLGEEGGATHFRRSQPIGLGSRVDKFFKIQNVTRRERLRLAYICMEGSASYWFRF